jgi:NTE family protein
MRRGVGTPEGRTPRIALVLSGGGARGAYEAGVLRYILDELPARLGRPIAFDIITGTSVGAVHACFVSAVLGQSGAGAALGEIWKSMSAETVYNLGLGDLLSAPLKVLGLGVAEAPEGEILGASERMSGLLNTTRLEELVHDKIPWKDVRRNIDSGRLSALAIAATQVATGRTKVFVDTAVGAVSSWPHDPFVDACAARIRPVHALASAAIPFFFPMIRVDDAYYCDGGLRLNTPLAPALRLGADRVLVIALRSDPTVNEAMSGHGNGGPNGATHGAANGLPPDDTPEAVLAARREADCTRPAFLAGKLLNALLLDHVDYDLSRLRLFNAILEDGQKAYGDGFLERINQPIVRRRGMPYRVVRDLCIRPSRDIGELAYQCAEHHRWSSGLRARLASAMVRYATRGAAEEGDLLSYVFFDRCFAEHLIEMGAADAAARADELLAFFSE